MASTLPRSAGDAKPPQARRLNRNAAIVAGAVLLVTLLVIVFLLTNSPTQASDARAAAPQSLPSQPGSAEPGFLDRPPGEVPVPPAMGSVANGERMAGLSGDPLSASNPYGVYDPSAGDPYASAYVSAPRPSAPSVSSSREQAYQRALQSDILAGSSGPSAGASSATGWGAPVGPDPYGAQVAETYVGSLGASPYKDGGSTASSAGFLSSGVTSSAAASSGGRALAPTTLTYTVQPAPLSYRQAAPATYTLFAGAVIPALMITGINSDLAGDLLAQVSRNVYSSDQRALLIPKGSRLIGRYDDQVALGQNRLVVAWTRLILPDGRSIAFPGLPTQDPAGASGVRDRVNNHYTRTFGNALLLSGIGAGFQLSQPRGGSVFSNPSTGEIAAAEVARELSAVSSEMIRRNMSIKPTIEVRPGTPFVVFLNGDIELAPYPGAS